MYDASSEGLPYGYKLVNYASYYTIKKYKSMNGEEPNGVYFNKILSLINKKHSSIKLPHYWYRYGDQVCRQKMPKALNWNSEELNETKVFWDYEKFDYFKEFKGHYIEEDIEHLIDEYSDNFEKLIDDVYSYAPFEFQREFLELRKTFYGINNAYNWDIESYKELSKPIFKKTFNEFPIHEFIELSGEFNLVKSFINLRLASEDWKFKKLEKISKDFWFLFCYHLRLNPKARENIPPDILHYWEDTLTTNTSRHRKSIADTIIESIKKDRSLLEDDVIREFYEWRIKDKKETKEVIDTFLESYNSNTESE